MAFGLKRAELLQWKESVQKGEIAFLTHFWLDDRFPGSHCVTKVGCSDVEKLACWGKEYGLKREWIHFDQRFPHYDLMGEIQLKVLRKQRLENHILRFKLNK
ncbi:hypothetical protein ACFFIX_22190 [Metabacillus herbersteinensis]|uniref:YneQ n=1 Tax=Metabacillus herbersteinensis TaxID=283816 RepID=A0ABV6GKF3_9BACI